MPSSLSGGKPLFSNQFLAALAARSEVHSLSEAFFLEKIPVLALIMSFADDEN
jgi:hypothetical protein